MKTVQELRSTLGLSQQALADYLGITRGHLSMCEIGLRSLNTAALVKLSEIESGFHVTKEKQSPVNYMPRIEKQPVRQSHSTEQSINFKIATLSKRLEKMRSIYEQDSRLFHVLEHIAEKETGHWLTRQLQLVHERRQLNCEGCQQKIIDEINILSAETDTLRGRPDGIKDSLMKSNIS